MIGPHHQYPDGAVLFLGTMFAPIEDRDAPGQGFTHKIGDIVTIAAPKLGRLVNRMRHRRRLRALDLRRRRPDAQPRCAPAHLSRGARESEGAGSVRRVRFVRQAIVAGALLAAAPAKAEITVAVARITEGSLWVIGQTDEPEVEVTLDGAFTEKADRRGYFRFRVVHHPPDCIVRLRSATQVQ